MKVTAYREGAMMLEFNGAKMKVARLSVALHKEKFVIDINSRECVYGDYGYVLCGINV